MAKNGRKMLNGCIEVKVIDDMTFDAAVQIETRLKEASGSSDAFFVLDLGDVVKKYNLWKKLLPNVMPYYAVKCNDTPAVLQVLANLGTGFDCAGKDEIGTILNMSVSTDRIVYANPVKQISNLEYATQHNVSLMSFDGENELMKIKSIHPDARLLLRILPPYDRLDYSCDMGLGMKFGCHASHAMTLIRLARDLKLNVVGISFHVGSGCNDANAFVESIKMAKQIFDDAEKEDIKMTLLDIGGGFYGNPGAKLSFEEVCRAINPTLKSCFPESSGVRIIAEPGRFFVETAFTLAANVIGYKSASTLCKVGDLDGDAKFQENMYYLNEGINGSLMHITRKNLEDSEMRPTPLKLDKKKGEPSFPCSLWGPTCSGMDVIADKFSLPHLDAGDWLVFPNAGAYTLTYSTNFNFRYSTRVFHTMEKRYCLRHPRIVESCPSYLGVVIHHSLRQMGGVTEIRDEAHGEPQALNIVAQENIAGGQWSF